MHSAPNLGPACAHRCAQAMRTVPRPRAHYTVSWSAVESYRSLGPPYRGLGRLYRSTHARAPARCVVRPTSYRNAAAHCIARHPQLARLSLSITIQHGVSRHNPPAFQTAAYHDTIVCIVTRSPTSHASACHDTI